MSLKVGKKSGKKSPMKQKVPSSPVRFTGKTGQKDKSSWVLGVTFGNSRRREEITPSPEDRLWTGGHRDGGQYFCLIRKIRPRPPRRVCVDYRERQVSSFTFRKKCTFTFRVHYLIHVCRKRRKRLLLSEITLINM